MRKSMREPTTVPRIIALTGPLGVDKTSVAKALQALLKSKGKETVLESFTAPVYEILSSLNLENNWEAKKAVTAAIQKSMGSWALNTALENRRTENGGVSHLHLMPGGVLLDDLRTYEEAEWVREYHGAIVEITHEGIEYSEDCDPNQFKFGQTFQGSVDATGKTPEEIALEVFDLVKRRDYLVKRI
jgi:hypothetical protein